ncbi:MAG: peptidoglycan-associated lipoprotein Pal [Gammaproteobacteria bacterium]|jgi:peptidoglycan-associated lipoprotein|nr:peptidoglycan-associated lipoprotein [Chromatiales bacterium]MDP6674905.1 peptidoglycan-associated lipoprotein Pal [Gammaproteobacteria bacterium]
MFATKQWLIIGLMAVLAGCGGSSGTMMDEGTAADDGGASSDDSASLSSSGDDDLMSGGAYDDPTEAGGALEVRVVYFDFDKADVDEASRALLTGHGDYLAENSAREVRLEGHGDERGSREYNIGLGERRAQAVRQILLLNGASASQLSTVSYGEERPAVLGSDEEAWSLNRRVELIYNP